MRDTRIRHPPALANFWDIERPIPREAPVINIIFPERGLVIVVFVGEGWGFYVDGIYLKWGGGGDMRVRRVGDLCWWGGECLMGLKHSS